MMRKRDEGYALAFVLVVVVVICLVAVSMMTVSLRNLEAQTASVERMQEKYQVQGLMEEKISSVNWNPKLPKANGGDEISMAKQTIVNYLLEKFSTEGQSGDVSIDEPVDESASDLRFTADFTLAFNAGDNSGTVNVSILWTGKITDAGSDFEVSDSNVIYTSYEVVPVEQTQDGGGA